MGAVGRTPGGGPSNPSTANGELAAGLPKGMHHGPEATAGLAQRPDGAGGTKGSCSPFPERWLLWGTPPALPRAVRHTRQACPI